MAITRRNLVRGLGAGILGAGALSACGPGRRGTPTTPPPSRPELTEPDTPLVIGQIGASYGRMATFEQAIAVALDEARIDVNARWEGLFGHEVTLLERHVMQEPGEDLTPVIEELAGAGATCLITSIDEESLIAAMPAIVEAGLAVIDVFTSGMSVRSPEVQTSNLLMRLAPNDQILASKYAEIALGAEKSERSGTPGTIALLSEDTAQGQSLLEQLELYLHPRNGRIVVTHLYPAGEFGDIAAQVTAVLEEPPALVVLNGGQEAAPFLSALHEATLDEGNRPTLTLPVRLPPAAVVDYAQLPVAEELLPECLTATTGYRPGGDVSDVHSRMMLNRSAEFLTTGMAYSQQGYDALVLACLAAQHALSVTGTALAASVPAILTGSESCEDYGTCRQVMRTALEADGRATIAYEGRSGALELGPTSDARVGEMREYGWSEANELQEGTATGFEAAE